MGDVQLAKAKERGICGGRVCTEHDLLIVVLAEFALKRVWLSSQSSGFKGGFKNGF
jgi:hypothetical protein